MIFWNFQLSAHKTTNKSKLLFFAQYWHEIYVTKYFCVEAYSYVSIKRPARLSYNSPNMEIVRLIEIFWKYLNRYV